MAIFRSPGLADEDAPSHVLTAWNERIVQEVQSRVPSPFLTLDPAAIHGAQPAIVEWPGHPLEAENCVGEERAAKLSDWGWRGRSQLHNEYLEYGFLMQLDDAGRLRPKRFLATTELKEWWQILAVEAPDYFLDKVEAITGRRYSMLELFEIETEPWLAMTREQRKQRFEQYLVSDGWNPPDHDLNRRWLLFMNHRINGLDDLIYVVHFGAFPYAVVQNGVRRRATMEEIFVHEGTEYLFCRNADPAAANGAYDQAFMDGTEANPQGRKMAFADPLGMYIRTFTINGLLFYNGQAVLDSWTVKSRGQHGLTQRLEFGPPDNHPAFLDEIKFGPDDDASPVTGFQLAKLIEVGPNVVVGDQRTIAENEFKDIPAVSTGTIGCGANSGRCGGINALNLSYEQSLNHQPGSRGGG